MIISDWTPLTIFEARDNGTVTAENGDTIRVKLYSDGWEIGPHTSMDAWTACRVLNDMQATLNVSESA